MFGRPPEFTRLPRQAQMQQAGARRAEQAYAAEMAAAEQSLEIQSQSFPGAPTWTTEDYYPGGPAATRLQEGTFRGRADSPGSEILGKGVVGYSAYAGKILDEVTGAPMGLPSRVRPEHPALPQPQEVTEDALDSVSDAMRRRDAVAQKQPFRGRPPMRFALGGVQGSGRAFGEQVKAYLMGVFGR